MKENTTQKLLCSLSGIVSYTAVSRASGVSKAQITRYAVGLSSPRPEQHDRLINGLRRISEQLDEIIKTI
jgi:hypothetical protein